MLGPGWSGVSALWSITPPLLKLFILTWKGGETEGEELVLNFFKKSHYCVELPFGGQIIEDPTVQRGLPTFMLGCLLFHCLHCVISSDPHNTHHVFCDIHRLSRGTCSPFVLQYSRTFKKQSKPKLDPSLASFKKLPRRTLESRPCLPSSSHPFNFHGVVLQNGI